MGAIPTDCFASGFFVSDWNSFIYVAGRHAGLEWRGEPYDRSKNTSRLVAPSAAEGPAVLVKAPRRRQSIRILAAVASWAIAVWAGFVAASAAYVTFATNDYRPILIRGAWMGAIALVALHASALTAKGWKARSISVAGAILILVVLAEILGRLAAIAAHS